MVFFWRKKGNIYCYRGVKDFVLKFKKIQKDRLCNQEDEGENFLTEFESDCDSYIEETLLEVALLDDGFVLTDFKFYLEFFFSWSN